MASVKLKEIPTGFSEHGNYLHFCPGCQQLHMIPTAAKNENGAMWSFNGNMETPTFSPSVHLFSTDQKGHRHTSCHYFITGGFIDYCGDSFHGLKGTRIALPDIPEEFL